MKRFLAFLLIFAITFAVPSAGVLPLANALSLQDEGQGYDQGYDTYFSSDQLENLVAPVALYPDPLLAQVLLAATFLTRLMKRPAPSARMAPDTPLTLRRGT